MFNSGYVKSITFGASSFEPVAVSTLPPTLDLRDSLGRPVDQGDSGICVSVCVTDMVKYICLGTGQKYRKHVDFFYKHRSNKKVDGMSPRNAFEIAQANSLVLSYAIVRNVIAIRVALLANGPVLIALPVYNFDSDFWRKRSETDKAQGYHAVTLVGYDDYEEEFILRNSWGTGWGLDGYTYFPYKEQGSVLEAWTVFK